MEYFLDKLERLKIRVKSPTGLVIGGFSVTSGLEVEFSKPLRDVEPTLVQEELDAAINALIAGSRHGVNSLLGEKWTEANGNPRDPARQAVNEAERKILVQVRSRRNNVLVQIRGTEEFSVRLRPGITVRLDMNEQALAAEINSAIGQATQERDDQMIAAYKQYLGLDGAL